MFQFLQSFFTVFTELSGLPLFICMYSSVFIYRYSCMMFDCHLSFEAGESYAGAYIPWISDYIVNKQTTQTQRDAFISTATGIVNGNELAAMLYLSY